jgi:hypothetical protein
VKDDNALNRKLKASDQASKGVRHTQLIMYANHLSVDGREMDKQTKMFEVVDRKGNRLRGREFLTSGWITASLRDWRQAI